MEQNEIKYNNTLPPQYQSWAELYVKMQLPQALAEHIINCEVGKMKFYVPQGTDQEGQTYSGGYINLDMDFFKARLFEDVISNLVIDLEMARKIKALTYTHPDQTPFKDGRMNKVIDNLMFLASLKP